MAKVIVIYEEPKDKEGFDSYYFNVHIPLVKRIQNLRGAGLNRVVQSVNADQNPYIVAELEFENLDTLNQALSSAAWQEVQGDFANHLVPYFTKPPVILIAE